MDYKRHTTVFWREHNAREKGELWRKLCEQAAVEKNPEKLLELTKEINRLLGEKEARLKYYRAEKVTR